MAVLQKYSPTLMAGLAKADYAKVIAECASLS